MNLNQWAIKWGVPFAAVEDLRSEMCAVNTDVEITTGESETAVQSRIRLEASRKGARLWRNNLGAVETVDGRFIRYGLVNDSKAMNEKLKSSDLIGIKPVVIIPEMVGWTIGQFVAREIKPERWQYSATKREKAQLKFLQLIMALGGDACFAVGEGTL